MAKVFFIVIFVMGFQARAFENRFSVNNNPDVTWTDITVGQYDSQYNTFNEFDFPNDTINGGSVHANRIDIGIRQAISESSEFEAGTMVQSRQFYSQASAQQRSVVEVGSVRMGYKKSFFYQPMTLNIGANGQLNFGAKSREFDNGQNFIEPWIGNEFYVGKYAMGLKASYTQYGRPAAQAASLGRKRSYKGIGFIDVPLFQKLDVGVGAGLAYHESDRASAFLSRPGYLSELDVRYKVTADTQVTASVQSANDVVEDASSTQWSVGLSRAL